MAICHESFEQNYEVDHLSSQPLFSAAHILKAFGLAAQEISLHVSPEPNSISTRTNVQTSVITARHVCVTCRRRKPLALKLLLDQGR